MFIEKISNTGLAQKPTRLLSAAIKTHRFWGCVMVSTLLLSAAPGYTRVTAANSLNTQDSIRIPFEIERSRIFIEAMVNDRGPFRFMVDTGASGIGRADVRLVKQLQLKQSGSASNSDGVNTATVPLVHLESLKIGRLVQENVDVMSRDYNRNATSDTKLRMGIIGRDFFIDWLLTINYTNRELLLSRGSLKSSGQNIVSFERPIVIPIVLGDYPSEGFVDTGSTVEMHLPLEWAKKLGVRELVEAGEARRANTVFKMYTCLIPVQIEIAGNKIKQVNAHFSERANRINIGGRLLANNGFILTLDQKEQLIDFRLP